MGDSSHRNMASSRQSAGTPNLIVRSDNGHNAGVTDPLHQSNHASFRAQYNSDQSAPFYLQFDSLSAENRDASQISAASYVNQPGGRMDMTSLGHHLPDMTSAPRGRQFTEYQGPSSIESQVYYSQSQHFGGYPQMHHDQHQYQQQQPRQQYQQRTAYQQPQYGTSYANTAPILDHARNRAFNMISAPQHIVNQHMYTAGGHPIDSRAFATPAGPPLPRFAPQQASAFGSSGTEATPSYPRGPPRKPKQSGHALWVGNLPQGTSILGLKDHFSREATQDIESVFLISKSNCAFVNYKSEFSCQAAMNRFHDSRFNGVRLVCRLRRGPASTTQRPSPREDGSDVAPHVAPTEAEDVVHNIALKTGPKSTVEQENYATNDAPEDRAQIDGLDGSRVSERFFVVKSLTLQDLQASVRDGIWATQSHNERNLNKAFESADAVYLIFSANKSGEYFGYAKMLSTIGSSTVTSNPRARPDSASLADGPTSKPTPATDYAPKGRVIDDSARGTIFWEAEPSDSDPAGGSVADFTHSRESSRPEVSDNEPSQQDWGKPFRIEWQSTNRLAFYRTRGLRNPWNSNREVKIARDGTELEPSVGRRLVSMFHRPAGAPAPMSLGMVSGYTDLHVSPPAVAMGTTQGMARDSPNSNSQVPQSHIESITSPITR